MWNDIETTVDYLHFYRSIRKLESRKIINGQDDWRSFKKE